MTERSVTTGDELLYWDFQDEIPESWTYEGREDFYSFDFDGFTSAWFEEPFGWAFIYDNSSPGNIVLTSQSWVTDADSPVNDWFVTPRFEIPNTSDSYEGVWEARAYEAAPYNDGYDVGVIENDVFLAALSNSGADAELLAALESATTWLFSNSEEGENPDWTLRSINISSYKGKTVRLVWRNTSYDKNAVYLNFISANKVKNGTGIFSVKDQSIRIARQGDNFLLTYPASAPSVSVYNATGRKIAEYSLSATGSYILPAAGWNTGVYILQFKGENTTSVKILK
jgi:hypothetical protein